MEKNIFMELLAAREFKAIRSILNVMNAVDIASLLSEFEEKELAQAFRLIPKAKASGTSSRSFCQYEQCNTELSD